MTMRSGPQQPDTTQHSQQARATKYRADFERYDFFTIGKPRHQTPASSSNVRKQDRRSHHWPKNDVASSLVGG